MMLSMSEAVYYAMMPFNIKNGHNKFKRWRDKIMRKLNPQKKITTVWDKLSRQRKKGKPTVKMV